VEHTDYRLEPGHSEPRAALREESMSQRLRWLLTALVVLGGCLLAASIFAMASYEDDAAEQGWQFEVGMGIVRYGIWLLVGVGAATVLTALRKR